VAYSSPVASFEAIAADYPVFRIDPNPLLNEPPQLVPDYGTPGCCRTDFISQAVRLTKVTRADALARADMHQPGQRLAGARYPGDHSVAPYGTFPIIRFASSTEKPRSVSLRTLPSEPAFRSAVVTASSGPSKIITMS